MHKKKAHVALKNGHHHAPEQVLAKLLLKAFSGHSTPIIIAVGGPGGIGKSTFSRLLAKQLGHAAVLRLDEYKTSRTFRAERKIFGPHPEANKLELLSNHLTELKANRTFQRPVYDQNTGETWASTRFTPAQFNILDGEIATYPEFRDLVDFSIFIDSDWKTQLKTRVVRDIEERGYDRDKAIATFLQSNLREFSAFGAASKTWADVHLYCDEDYHLAIESVSSELLHAFEQHSDYSEIGIQGLIVPVLTPFTSEGAIDQQAFIRHLEFLAQNGIHRIMVNGTTAEVFSLLPEERKLLLKLARRYFPGLIVQHAGGTGLSQNIREMGWANDLGADAVAVLPPIYPTALAEKGLIHYFTELGKTAEIPFMLFNFPKHSGNAITPEILKAVPHYGLKDSSQNLDLMGSTPRYFMGSSTNLLKPMQCGATGFVSASANVRPELYSELETLIASGQLEKAEIQQAEVRKFSAPFSKAGIPALKVVLSEKLAKYPRHVRCPLVTL